MNDGQLKRAGETLVMAITANTTVFKTWIAPCDGSLKYLDLLVTGSAPASTLGTYLLTVANGAVNQLAATNFNLESLVAGTISNPTLSATDGALDFDEGDVITFSAVSNNADLTGPAELFIGIRYHHR